MTVLKTFYCYILFANTLPFETIIKKPRFILRYMVSYLIVLSLYAHENKISSNTTQTSLQVSSRSNFFSFIKDFIDVVDCLLKLTPLKLKKRKSLHIWKILVYDYICHLLICQAILIPSDNLLKISFVTVFGIFETLKLNVLNIHSKNIHMLRLDWTAWYNKQVDGPGIRRLSIICHLWQK